MTDHRASRRRRTAGQHLASLVKELLLVVVGAVVVASLLRALVGQMFLIPSESMENTLLKGDRVLVQKITDFQRGDVVVFQDPAHWLGEEPVVQRGPVDRILELIGIPTASTPGHLIKRVIGLPGDTVVCCDRKGRVSVNGDPLDETGYLYVSSAGRQVRPSEVRFRVVVPKGRIFVLGDHRNASADSRCHLSEDSGDHPRGTVAFVPEDLVVGPAFAVVAPFDRAARFSTPKTFAEVPPAERPAPEHPTIKPADVAC